MFHIASPFFHFASVASIFLIYLPLRKIPTHIDALFAFSYKFIRFYKISICLFSLILSHFWVFPFFIFFILRQLRRYFWYILCCVKYRRISTHFLLFHPNLHTFIKIFNCLFSLILSHFLAFLFSHFLLCVSCVDIFNIPSVA